MKSESRFEVIFVAIFLHEEVDKGNDAAFNSGVTCEINKGIIERFAHMMKPSKSTMFVHDTFSEIVVTF